jgi:CBS domain-containing protein
MVTSWDLVDSLPPDTKVSQMMTEDIITIGPQASLVAAAEKMMVNYVHHLAVADDRLKILGIISSFDLLGEIISDQEKDLRHSQPA